MNASLPASEFQPGSISGTTRHDTAAGDAAAAAAAGDAARATGTDFADRGWTQETDLDGLDACLAAVESLHPPQQPACIAPQPLAPPGMFVTGLGAPVAIAADKLAAARRLLGEDTMDVAGGEPAPTARLHAVPGLGSGRASAAPAASQPDLPSPAWPAPAAGFQGFTTGLGAPVAVDAARLEAARKLLDDGTLSPAPGPAERCAVPGFCTGLGAAVHVSAKNLAAAGRLLDDGTGGSGSSSCREGDGEADRRPAGSVAPAALTEEHRTGAAPPATHPRALQPAPNREDPRDAPKPAGAGRADRSGTGPPSTPRVTLGFTTGLGGAVTISADRLAAARKLLAGDDDGGDGSVLGNATPQASTGGTGAAAVSRTGSEGVLGPISTPGPPLTAKPKQRGADMVAGTAAADTPVTATPGLRKSGRCAGQASLSGGEGLPC